MFLFCFGHGWLPYSGLRMKGSANTHIAASYAGCCHKGGSPQCRDLWPRSEPSVSAGTAKRNGDQRCHLPSNPHHDHKMNRSGTYKVVLCCVNRCVMCGVQWELWANAGDGHARFSEAEIPADSIRNVTLEQARGQDGFTLFYQLKHVEIHYHLRIWNTIHENTAPPLQ